MSDTVSEILIKIRMALESGGAEAAKAKLEELTTATTEQGAVQAKAAVSAEQLATQSRGLLQVFQGLHAASNGSALGLLQVQGGLQRLLGVAASAGPAIAAVATALVSFKLGTGIVEGLDALGEKLESRILLDFKAFRDVAADTLSRLKMINEVSFDRLKAELEDAASKASEIQDEIGREFGAKREHDAAESEKAVAEAEALPAGPERERAIVAARGKGEADQLFWQENEQKARIAQFEKEIAQQQERLKALQLAQRTTRMDFEAMPTQRWAVEQAAAAQRKLLEQGPVIEKAISEAEVSKAAAGGRLATLGIKKETAGIRRGTSARDVEKAAGEAQIAADEEERREDEEIAQKALQARRDSLAKALAAAKAEAAAAKAAAGEQLPVLEEEAGGAADAGMAAAGRVNRAARFTPRRPGGRAFGPKTVEAREAKEQEFAGATAALRRAQQVESKAAGMIGQLVAALNSKNDLVERLAAEMLNVQSQMKNAQ